MNKAKISFFFLALMLANVLACATNAFYFSVFVHDRYWDGTIQSVSETEAEILSSLLPSLEIERVALFEQATLARLFSPVDGKLLVEVQQRDTLIYSNMPAPERNVKERLSDIEISDDIKVTLGYFEPPPWHIKFTRWMVSPTRWFTPSYDFITVPHLFFMVIYLLLIYALGWRMRARHLSDDVMSIISPNEAH